MRNDRELLGELGSETNIGHALAIFESFSGGIGEGAKLGNIPRTSSLPSSTVAYTSLLLSSGDVREKAKIFSEPIKGLDSVSESTTSGILFVESWNRTERFSEPIKGLNSVSESITSGLLFNKGWLDLFEIEERIRSELRQLPETHWVQNLRHPTYHLRQPIPILIERADGTVTATYDDVELCGTGDSVKAAMSDLCGKIVARCEKLGESTVKSQEYKFLKQIIEEVEPPAWQELKQLYKEKLEEIPCVQEGYIKIEGNDADVIIVISEYSVDRIEQLAGIDLEINLKFRPLSFFVEYKLSENYLELDDFDRFY